MVSIIIPVYNASQFITPLMDSLLEQTGDNKDNEIILINDGSTDDTENVINNIIRDYKNVRYKKIENKGPAIARNIGIEMAKGEILLFTDADCVPPYNWIFRMVAAFKDAPDSEIVYGPVKAHIPNLSPFFCVYNTDETEFISFANVGIRREVFRKIGMLNVDFSYIAEDWEFTQRSKHSGLRMNFITDMVVYHPPRYLGFAYIDTVKRINKDWLARVALHKLHGDAENYQNIKRGFINSIIKLIIIAVPLIFLTTLPFGLRCLLAPVPLIFYNLRRTLYVRRMTYRYRIKEKVNIIDALKYCLIGWSIDIVCSILFLNRYINLRNLFNSKGVA